MIQTNMTERIKTEDNKKSAIYGSANALIASSDEALKDKIEPTV